jgi:hypothetical protein
MPEIKKMIKGENTIFGSSFSILDFPAKNLNPEKLI